jgi:hypothetical protein
MKASQLTQDFDKVEVRSEPDDIVLAEQELFEQNKAKPQQKLSRGSAEVSVLVCLTLFEMGVTSCLLIWAKWKIEIIITVSLLFVSMILQIVVGCSDPGQVTQKTLVELTQKVSDRVPEGV